MKIRHVTSGRYYNCRATKKPLRSEHRGRTWDVSSLTIDGEKIDGWRDYTWGSNTYFPFAGRWYAISTDAVDFEKTQEFVTL